MIKSARQPSEMRGIVMAMKTLNPRRKRFQSHKIKVKYQTSKQNNTSIMFNSAEQIAVAASYSKGKVPQGVFKSTGKAGFFKGNLFVNTKRWASILIRLHEYGCRWETCTQKTESGKTFGYVIAADNSKCRVICAES